MAKLLVWNIQQGGGKRRQRIADCILRHDPDVVALIEFVPGTASRCSTRWKRAGFGHEVCTKRNGFNYAVCVLSKMPVHAGRSGIPILDDSGQWLEVNVPASGFALGLVHAPTNPRSVMREFLSALVRMASLKAADPFLFVGDFNTGTGPADGPLKNYGDVDRFLALQDAGFTDAWRFLHRDEIEHTWCRAGKSYRIDHALASQKLLPRIRECRYSHDERENGVSDHSVLLVEIQCLL